MADQNIELDAVIVGAGFAGMYAIYRLRNMGLSVRAYERGDDVGGTWYWNRYPGARCDVPSIDYSYSFDPDLEQEWNWTEIMAAQPEILAYAQHVADRFDLRRDIQFETEVETAHFDEASRRWQVTTNRGDRIEARFLIMATGSLSQANTPEFEGLDTFKGAVYHTGRWPKEGVDFSGQRVGIIGTGSSGIQAIPEIARDAAHLTVFQRTPNYTMPAHNAPLSAEYLADVKRHYREIRETQRNSLVGIVAPGLGFGGSGATPPTENILETTEEERRRLLDEEGFAAIRRFVDVMTDLTANEVACEMYRQQVSRVVDDPETAEKLMPRGYPIGCKRPVIDTGYFETFNRDNVTLIDLQQGSIERITETGVQTAQGHFELDALVFATGFDAMTGSYLGVDIRGPSDNTLRDAWHAGPKTYLGLTVHGFPNLFLITGPGSPSVLTNMMVSTEQHIDWVADCIAHMDDRQLRSIEATDEAQEAWVEEVNIVSRGTMHTAPTCNSWYLGANIPGKTRVFMPYSGGFVTYRERCEEIVAAGYEGFTLSP